MNQKLDILPIQKFRELELIILFCFDFQSEIQKDELLDFITLELKVAKRHVRDALHKVEEIQKQLDMLDAAISQVSTSYDLKRINYVERAILRLGVFELHVVKKLDPAIVIAEAKRLARKFSTAEAAAFCQALLNATITKTS